MYNSASDKYLNYFVVRIHPNCNRPKRASPAHRLELVERANHQRFQDMLKQYQERTEVRSAMSSVPLRGKGEGNSVWDGEGEDKENRLVAKIGESIRYRKRQKTI